MKWLKIQVGDARVSKHVSEGDLYMYSAVFSCPISLTSACELHECCYMKWDSILRQSPSVMLTRMLSVFHRSIRSDQSGDGWQSWGVQRDQNRCLNDTERNAYAIGKRLFNVPSCQLLTLDDELMCTRSKDNPVKALSAQKEDREGQMSDVLARALLCLTRDVRLYRRAETQVE